MARSWWLNNYLGRSEAKLEGPLDWKQWQGPAPQHPLDPNRFRNWRFFSDYAGGIVADQGAHVFDGIHLLMNASEPLAVTAAAGKPHKEGVDTPESVVVVAEYPEDFIALFTVNYAANALPCAMTSRISSTATKRVWTSAVKNSACFLQAM